MIEEEASGERDTHKDGGMDAGERAGNEWSGMSGAGRTELGLRRMLEKELEGIVGEGKIGTYIE